MRKGNVYYCQALEQLVVYDHANSMGLCFDYSEDDIGKVYLMLYKEDLEYIGRL